MGFNRVDRNLLDSKPATTTGGEAHHTPYPTPYTLPNTIHPTLHHTPYPTPYTLLYTIHPTQHHTPYTTPVTLPTITYTLQYTIHLTHYQTPHTLPYTLHPASYHTPCIMIRGVLPRRRDGGRERERRREGGREGGREEGREGGREGGTEGEGPTSQPVVSGFESSQNSVNSGNLSPRNRHKGLTWCNIGHADPPGWGSRNLGSPPSGREFISRLFELMNLIQGDLLHRTIFMSNIRGNV